MPRMIPKSPTTRRRFLHASALATGALPLTGLGAPPSDAEWAELERRARHRRRRIIMNNDGNDLRDTGPDEPVTRETFLAERTTPLTDSQVDSIFYCDGVFNFYKHRSEVSEELYREGVPGEFLRALFEQGIDPLQIMIDFCREHDREIFWSMRMNDTHDANRPELLCEWKRRHPEYLVGEKGEKYPYGCNRWSSVDYGLEPVREKVYRILEDVATRFDVDGLELDFFRHPVLFREQMRGERINQAQRDELTALIRRVREMTRRVGRERGRPMLIGVRVPDSVGYCRELGIDLEAWLEEGLVDVLTGGGYFHLTPWKDWAAVGHAHDVPTYACLVSRRLMDGGKPEADTAMQVWRGEALTAWRGGVDGIYTFNRFDPRDPIFRQLGDPAQLEQMPRVDQESFVADIWSKPGRWLAGGEKFVRGG